MAVDAKEALRVAIVGSGPAGFYSADFLLKSATPIFSVDLIERLPTPFGLVRFGVAPDHQNIKRVAAAFDRVAKHERFRFFGNVEVGKHVSLGELFEHYDQVLFATGSASDRRLGVPGEDLPGSHPATNFVGWYNAHPDFLNEKFNLEHSRAVVVGMGNVAMDVARILVRSPDELAETDIADYALEALRKSKVREVVLLGRRGAAQAAFEQGELADIAALSGVQVGMWAPVEELAPEEFEKLDAGQKKNVEFMRSLPLKEALTAERRVILRFLVSPAELQGSSRVEAIRAETNALVKDAGGAKAKGTGQFDELPCGLVMRSIGYQGVPISGVPFDAKSATIPNVAGRVLEKAGGNLVPGLYAVGWIKRGPNGLIGTNKSDAKDTTSLMFEDAAKIAASGRPPKGDALPALLADRHVRVVSYDDFRKLDALEVETGKQRGKVREKFHTVDEMLRALGG